MSFVLFFLISDFPEDAKWLTPAEKELMKVRIERDSDTRNEQGKMTLAHVIAVLTDCTLGFLSCSVHANRINRQVLPRRHHVLQSHCDRVQFR